MIQKLIPRLLNMEADETLVRPNEFSDAVNVKVDGDVGVDAGVIKYADGNVVIEFDGELSASTIERVVGVCEDEATDTIYVFTSGSGSDSIFMVEPDAGSYVFRLVVRSNSLELDPESFTAANIIRVYEKQIASVGLDSQTGISFVDGQEITDFADNTIIEEIDDVDEFGSSLFNIIPQLETPPEIFITQAQIDGSAPLVVPVQFLNVFNQGTATGTITVTYEAVNGNANYGSYETSVSPFASQNTIVFSAGQQQTVTLTLVSGSFDAEDGDVISFSITVVTSDGQVFEYDWNSTVVYVQAVSSDPVFTPTNLDHGDFGSVTEGVPFSFSKTYSISNPVIQNLTAEEQQLPYAVQVFVVESAPAGDEDSNYNLGDYSYLSYEQEGGVLLAVDGESSSPLSLTIDPGETVEFELVGYVPSTANVGVIEWNVEVKFLAQGGVLPPSISVLAGDTFSGQSQSLSITQELEDPEVLPAVVGFGGDGFGSVSGGISLDPVDTQGFFNGSTVQQISYDFVENNPQFTGNWTLVMEPSIVLDPLGWFSQWGGEAIRFSTSAVPGQNTTINGYGGPLPTLTWECSAGATSTVLATATSAYLSFEAKQDLQPLLSSGGVAGIYSLRWKVLETNATVFEEQVPVIIGQLPENASIEVAFASNGSSGSEQIPFSSVGTNGVQTISRTLGSFPFSGGSAVDENAFVLRIRNNGDVDLDMPEVRLSNTRIENPNGFAYISSQASSTYLGNSDYNGDYVNNNVVWSGIGSVPVAAPADSSYDNILAPIGISDLGSGDDVHVFGWNPMCYGALKGIISDGREGTLARYYYNGENETWGGGASPDGQLRTLKAKKEEEPQWTVPDDPYQDDNARFLMYDINQWNKENNFPNTAIADDYSCFVKFPISNFSILGEQNFAVNGVNSTNVLAAGEEVKIVFHPFGDGESNLTAFVEVMPPTGSRQQIEGREYKYKMLAIQAAAQPMEARGYVSGSDNEAEGVVGSNGGHAGGSTGPEKIVKPTRVTFSDKSTDKAVKKARFKKYK